MLEELHPCEQILVNAHKDYLNPTIDARVILDGIMAAYSDHRDKALSVTITPEILPPSLCFACGKNPKTTDSYCDECYYAAMNTAYPTNEYADKAPCDVAFEIRQGYGG